MNYIKYLIILTYIGILSLTACTNNVDLKVTQPLKEVNESGESGQEESTTEIHVIEIPEINDIDFLNSEKKTIDGINKFGISFLNVAAGLDSLFDTNGMHDHNIAVSPLSASIVLSLLVNSCDNDAEQSIMKMLGVSDECDFTAFINNMMRYISSYSNGVSVELANSVYYNECLNPTEEWQTQLSDKLYSSVYSLDFSDPESLGFINKWCAVNTHGKIPDFLSTLDESITALFLNAIYFSGAWASPFYEELTKKGTFCSSDLGIRNVDMMHQTFEYNYINGNRFQLLTIPFTNGVAEMVLLLPEENITATELARTISYNEFYDTFNQTQKKIVSLTIPKFSISTEAEITEVLQILGLPQFVNLSRMGIQNMSDNAKEILVRQKTFSSIDEAGAEVAVATDAEIWDTSTGIPTNKPDFMTVTIDRPFLCFFVDKKTGTILTASVINNI